MSNYRFFFKLSPLGGLGNNNNANNMGGGGQNTNFTYSFHGDPKATFAEFFGTSNPFENFFNLHSTGSGLFTEPLDSGLDSMDDPFAFSSLGGSRLVLLMLQISKFVMISVKMLLSVISNFLS